MILYPGLYVSGFGTGTKGFPSALKRIEDQAFASSKLTTVTIPSSVTFMGDRVFINSNVQTVTFEGDSPTFRIMPGSGATDHGTFEGASRLYSITIKEKNGDYTSDSYGMVYNNSKTKLVLVPQGRTAPYTFAVHFKKAASKNWSTAQAFKSNSIIKITPTAAVKYDICVKVKDSTGKIKKKYFVLTVTK